MATVAFNKAYLDGLVAIAQYVDPKGNHPTKVKGGLKGVTSPESRNTDLGNNNLHEGTWYQTYTAKGAVYFIFVPDPALIAERKPGTSILWHDFIVQHSNGIRVNLAPASVLRELSRGVVGD